MRVHVEWQGGMAFRAEAADGTSFVMDTSPAHGGDDKGVSPMQALLASLAACAAMDVISILRKKKQNVTGYRLEVTGERGPEGTVPRPFTRMTVRHVLSGEGIDPAAVKRAVELSEEKYCSVGATLRTSPVVESVWEIE